MKPKYQLSNSEKNKIKTFLLDGKTRREIIITLGLIPAYVDKYITRLIVEMKTGKPIEPEKRQYKTSKIFVKPSDTVPNTEMQLGKEYGVVTYYDLSPEEKHIYNNPQTL